ncbi:hypothetical protein HPB48_004245 [Haemaphysalis longicornis]|uniref:Uncharacterized protein n=1 Tax=Haemaphysalis longicornis TaxID=44386 RepID=A0A9J6FWI5_HAELO|nr:hypothetical protein HPB48_004245 [Haemaphysalis longicornis]
MSSPPTTSVGRRYIDYSHVKPATPEPTQMLPLLVLAKPTQSGLRPGFNSITMASPPDPNTTMNFDPNRGRAIPSPGPWHQILRGRYSHTSDTPAPYGAVHSAENLDTDEMSAPIPALPSASDATRLTPNQTMTANPSESAKRNYDCRHPPLNYDLNSPTRTAIDLHQITVPASRKGRLRNKRTPLPKNPETGSLTSGASVASRSSEPLSTIPHAAASASVDLSHLESLIRGIGERLDERLNNLDQRLHSLEETKKAKKARKKPMTRHLPPELGDTSSTLQSDHDM